MGEEDVEVAEARAVRRLHRRAGVGGTGEHPHADGADRGGAFQEAAARRSSGAGEIHLGKPGEMRTANAITHDVSSSWRRLGERDLACRCLALTNSLPAVVLRQPSSKLSARQPKRTADAACAAKNRASAVPLR